MRLSPSRASRHLAAFCACALAGLLAFAARPDRVAAGPSLWPWTVALADTDSVAVPAVGLPPARLDTLDADSLAAPASPADTTETDTTDADSMARARAYFPEPVEVGTSASVMARRLPGVRGRLGTYWRRQVTLDSSAYAYRVTESLGGVDRVPADITLDQYLAIRRQEAIGDQFRQLTAQRAARRDQQRRGGGLGFAVDIPGGEQSAFRTLFGKNEVALTVNGTSNVNLGLRYDRNSLQENLRPGSDAFAPDFGQDLNLNVAGTIGDKLAINVNYDTQSQFDFENQVSLVYTGYQDDIIQKIEAGNVFLQTPATLIRGGQRLFGLRTDLQFGPLAVTAVASQQDAETVDRVFEGGADAQQFRLAPYDYEDNTHFFLGYAFHNWWDAAHERPSNPQLPPGFRRIVGIEVWKHEPGLVNNTDQNIETTWALAFADLAEPTDVLSGGEAYLGEYNPGTGDYANQAAVLPDSSRDQYSSSLLARLRQTGSTATAQSVNLELGRPLPETGAFSNNVFRRLRDNVDYTFDASLGWLSLTTSLSDSDLLAVAYQYEDLNGRLITVGDYAQTARSTSQTGPRTILKLLRADRPTPADPLWDLTLRNIYRVGGRNLNPATFQLDITYEPSGASPSPLPQDLSFEQLTFLQVLGLDRVNEQGLATPDQTFDFRAGVTVDPQSGRVIFPIRQPFGDYLRNLIQHGQTVGTIGTNGRINVSLGPLSLDEAFRNYVPTQDDGTADGASLYDLLPTDARRRLSRLSDFLIVGEFKSATQSVFNIGFQLVEGTVRVTAGDLELREDVDYRVNYTAGTVEITNPQYLLTGQKVRVEVEQNKFFAIGSKTLLGLRADYRLAERFNLGATWMRLNERPLGDKFRVGEEPLQNSIVGFDGAFSAEPRWLTRAVDALPLIQTRAPSRFEIRGEVARINPGSPQTLAFDRARDALREAGLDFDLDETEGISYIDDFEGSENAFTGLRFTNGWRIAAPPRSAGPVASQGPAGDGGAFADPTDPVLRNNWRGLFAWYSITEETYREIGDLVTPATKPIQAGELYTQREFANPRERNRFIDFLDLYFDPARRGPYNYNQQLGTTFAQNPRDVWGGFARQIESSYSNFDGQNNIEFVEMLVAPLGGKQGNEAIAPGAVLHLDLGRINEDVLPNGFLNSEDGLPDGGTSDNLDNWGRRPSGRTNGFVDFFEGTRRTEDLGLDGLPSQIAIGPGTEPYPVTESTFEPIQPFLTSSALPDGPERVLIQEDPAGDDYFYFLDPRFDDTSRYNSLPGRGATIQERYAHYFPAFELNSAVAQQELIDGGQGVAIQPNSEDINGNNTLDPADAFHRYTIPLDEAGLLASPFFLNTLVATDEQGASQTFYLLRIPVRTENKQEFGGIEDDDFSRIEAVRMWTTGHDKAATLRFASFELVGSQWLKSETVGFNEDAGDQSARSFPPQLFVETINNEENNAIYAIPRGTVQNVARSTSGQITTVREQSLVFRAEGLADGRRAGLVRSYATRPLDLTKYSNLRVDVHGDGFERSDSMYAFIRFGDDETENYYEIEQPVYPYDPADFVRDGLAECPRPPATPSNCVRSDSLWQTNVQVGNERIDLNPINVVLASLNDVKLERDRTTGVTLDQRFTVPAGEDAPPGSRITVRGQPSIQDIRTIVLGVRNGPGGAAVVDTVSLWFNELRVTGYDEAGGSSGFLTANMSLADVASVNARLSFTEDGFGDLGGTLGARSFASQTAFTLTSSFAAHKLLPERYGWQIPVSFSLTQNGSTPRFDPDNGDVRLDDLIEAARTGDGEVVGDDVRAEDILERARTQTSSTNVRVSAQKSGSRSPWLRYTIDGITASYSLSEQSGSNPSAEETAQDSWTGNLAYRVSGIRPLTVRPFWFTGGVPLVRDVLGSLRVNLLPRDLTLSADAGRSLSTTRPRLNASFLSEPDSIRDFRALTRRTQRFEHGRQSNFQYTPVPFLQLSLATNTDQDLGAAGQRESFRTLVRERDGGFYRVYDLSPAEARADTSIVYADLVDALDGFNDGDSFPIDRVEILGGSDLEILPLGEALANAFDGDLRTRGYEQRATASLRISTRRLAWLRWLQLQPISYTADYDWRDQPSASAPELEVASAGTRASVQSSLKIVPRDFWRLFPFYRAMERSAGRGPTGRSQTGNRQRGQTPAQAAPRAAADSTDSGGGFNPLRLARDGFLAATSIDDISLTYRGSATVATGGLEGQSYSLLSGITGDAPPLGYRLGFIRELGVDRRITDDRAFNTFSDLLGSQHDLDARTQLSPLRGLSIGLNWRTAWTISEEIDYSLPDDGGPPISSIGRRAGGGTATVFGFGGSYEGLVDRHAERYTADVAGTAADTVQTEFLSPIGLANDFGAELGHGAGGFGPNGLFALPLPNWSITYSGLERLPVLRWVANQVSLQHGYSSTSETRFATLFDPGTRVFSFDGQTLAGEAAFAEGGYDEPTSVTINERFQPLIGLTFGFKGNVQASFSTNRTSLYTLQTGTAQLSERSSRDLRVDLSYARQGLRLFGLRGINNNIRFQLTALIADDATTTRQFLDDITARTVGDGVLTDPTPQLTSRIQVSPQISYTVSNQVTANLIAQYDYTNSELAGRTNRFTGGVTLRILFSN